LNNIRCQFLTAFVGQKGSTLYFEVGSTQRPSSGVHEFAITFFGWWSKRGNRASHRGRRASDEAPAAPRATPRVARALPFAYRHRGVTPPISTRIVSHLKRANAPRVESPIFPINSLGGFVSVEMECLLEVRFISVSGSCL